MCRVRWLFVFKRKLSNFVCVLHEINGTAFWACITSLKMVDLKDVLVLSLSSVSGCRLEVVSAKQKADNTESRGGDGCNTVVSDIEAQRASECIPFCCFWSQIQLYSYIYVI